MYCRNCGGQFKDGQSFCTNCGTKRVEEQPNNQNVQMNNVPQNNTQQNINAVPKTENVQQNINQQTENINEYRVKSIPTDTTPKKGFNPVIIIVIVFALIIIGIVGLVSTIFVTVSNNSNKLICTSDKGDITIMYNEKSVVGYTANGLSYDLDKQQDYAEEVGINAYLEEFNDWFVKNTAGTCTIDGNVVSTENNDNEKNKTTNDVDDEMQTIGSNELGYVNVPEDWIKFYDPNATAALQYSYAGVYIVTLDMIKNPEYTAKEYASSYLSSMKNSTEVTGATGATVKIGKNKEYTAYQIYMYYPKDGIYLVTYWFEAEDNNVHYIALEGPTELNGVKITDYLYIADSYSLKKK